MADRNNAGYRLSIFWVLCLLFVGAVPIVWHSIHRLHEVSLKASASLPKVSPTEDAVWNWGASVGFLFATTFFALFFALAESANRRIRRLLLAAVLLYIVLGPFSLVLGIRLAFPSIYVPSLTMLLILLGTGVLCLIFGFFFGLLLTTSGPWWGLRMSLVLAGFSLSVLLAFPLRLFGEHTIRMREVSLRQQYNEETIRKAKLLAENACRQALAYDSLIADLESQAIPADDAPEPASLASQGPVLYYHTFYTTPRHSIDIDMTLKGLGPFRPTRELQQLASLTDQQDFSSRDANLGATLTLACVPFHDFRIYYGPHRNFYVEKFNVGDDLPPLPDPGTIRTAVRFNLVKNEIVGYYGGTGIPGKDTTIEVEVISLPARRIVAKKSFVGHPLHSINADAKFDSVGGSDEAVKQGNSWLDLLYAEPNSPTAGQ